MTTERPRSYEDVISYLPKAFDLDAVLAETHSIVTGDFNQLFGTSYKPSDIREWDTVYYWCRGQGLDHEHAKRLEQQLWFDPDRLYRAEPVKGAVDYLQEQHDHGIDLAIITGRLTHPDVRTNILQSMEESTHEWVKKWFPFFDRNKLFIKGDNPAPIGIYKSLLLQVLKYPVYFEDATPFARSILSYTDLTLLVLMSNVTVLEYEGHRNVLRIPGIDGALPNFEDVRKGLKNYNVAQY